MYTYTCIYIYVCMYLSIHIYIYIYTYTHVGGGASLRTFGPEKKKASVLLIAITFARLLCSKTYTAAGVFRWARGAAARPQTPPTRRSRRGAR